MSNYKVYLSSTFRDLKEYRNQVIDFFGKKTIKENFDLLSMEGYVAGDVAPAEECVADVKKCNILILVIANRYGFIPPTNNPQGLSITEMEYNTAIANDDEKTILAFFADETDPRFEYDNDADPAVVALKKEKLAAFKQRVREAKLTHPEPFVSSYHLTLQIAESLMRKSMIAYRMENARSYCCDRVPQFSKFLQVHAKGIFKTFIVYGSRKELGLNLINRINIFSLDLPDDALQNQLVTFEDILVSDDYVQNRNNLLAYTYNKCFHKNLPDVSLDAFLEAFTTAGDPLVLVINCDPAMFEENQQQFARQFIEELYKATAARKTADIYFFLNFEDNTQSPDLEQKIKQLQQSIPGQESFLYVLPKLQPLTPQLIKTWIINYITPNPGRAEELMDMCFSNLAVPLSMQEADKKIHAFITAINNNDEKILNILR